MKALTIQQPWADLIASGIKRVENRSWPTSHRGLIAIHAGASQKAMKQNSGLVEGEPVYSAIIAVAEIVDCLPLLDAVQRRLPGDPLEWVVSHEFTEGPYCWVLENVRRLEKPIPCTGALSLWTVPEEIARRLE